jgi:hypothetical protein
MASAPKDVIAVDLDGTLAEYHGFKGHEHIGEPIEPMLERVKGWLSEGKRVIIHTARAHDPKAIPPIRKWLKQHLGQELPVTDRKDPRAKEFWDDRAVTVQKNTGKILTKGVKAKARAMSV